MINIAMVEDDAELAEVLTQYLSKFNINVTNYEEPFLALSSLKINKFDLIILDLTLPGMDGLDVCKEIIANHHDIPIIISSARSDITDKVTALQLGADDYLPKPYDPRELEVRIKTILRRYNTSTKADEKPKKVFVFDEEKKEIRKDDKFIRLTAAEYEVLSLLIKREGFVVSRDDIFENSNLLNSDYDNIGSLAVIINRIRHKIEENPKTPEYLHTIRGMGYKFIQ